MITIPTNKITLIEAAAALWEAQNEESAVQAMAQMQQALQDASVQERIAACDELRSKAHEFVFDVAWESCADPAIPENARFIALNRELEKCWMKISASIDSQEEMIAREEVAAMLGDFSHCKTLEMLCCWIDDIQQYMNNYLMPRNNEDSLLKLRLEQEMIDEYLNSMAYFQETDWLFRYRSSLFAALNEENGNEENGNDYVLDMLYLRNGIFGVANIADLLTEKDHDALMEGIRLWLNALSVMPSHQANRMQNTMMLNICSLILRHIDEDFVPVSGDIAFMNNCLRKIIEEDIYDRVLYSGNADAEIPHNDLDAVLAGMAILQKMAVGSDVDVLADEWMEFMRVLEYVPQCAKALCDQAVFLLGGRIFRTLLDEEAFASTPVLERLMRLFLLCGLVGAGVRDGDALMKWMVPENICWEDFV